MTSPVCTTIPPPARDRPAARAEDRDRAMAISAFLSAMGDHFVYEDGPLRISVAGSPALIVIAGDVNEVTYPGLVGALRRAAQTPGPIQVDLAELEDCDLAGLRAIVCLTGASSRVHSGVRSVVLHKVPRHLTAVMRILGWDTTPGLTLHEPNWSM